MATPKENKGWLIAMVVAAVGLVFQLAAERLAQQQISDKAWQTNPADVQNYQRIGMAIMAFGLVLLVIMFHRWMWQDEPSNSN